MESQLTVRLPRDLSKALKERAAEMRRKPSEVVRIAVLEFLQAPHVPVEQAAKRVQDLIGSLSSGVPDLAVRHREHLIRKLSRVR